MILDVGRDDTLDLVALGQRLRAIREDRGMAATKLDDLANVGRGTVRRIELGERPEISLSVIVRIASYLHVQIDWLVWGDRPEAPHGLNIPCASFLAQINRLPGLLDYLESPVGIATSVQTVARVVHSYRKHPPEVRMNGEPLDGWDALITKSATSIRRIST
jgi:transcriptional regulator with XRE-family HTH domain